MTRRWVLKACPECDYAVTLVNAPVHKQGCSHPDCEIVVVAEVPEKGGIDYGCVYRAAEPKLWEGSD